MEEKNCDACGHPIYNHFQDGCLNDLPIDEHVCDEFCDGYEGHEFCFCKRMYVGISYPIHHENDGDPIQFHVKQTNKILHGYWAYPNGFFSTDTSETFDNNCIDWAIPDENDE